MKNNKLSVESSAEAHGASPTNQAAEKLRSLNVQLTAQLDERTTQLGLRTTQLGVRTAELGERTGQLGQSQKMEAMGNLAGGIAHDFNNILSVILIETEAGLQSADLNSETYKSLEQIRKSSERAASLTRQLLAFSRKQIILPMVANLNDLVRDMEKMLFRLIEANIVLEWNLDPSIKNIKVDPSHFEQIIVNLVVNSRDAMPKGGKLKIATQTSVVDNVPYTTLKVSDNGVGMSEETKDHIFDPFFTTKDIGKGTGLGLSTVFGIVEQHKGFISVESKMNEGTTFKVHFPQVYENVVATSPLAIVIKKLTGTETILVAEDEPILRDLVSKMLGRNGYKVLTASDGLEALKLIQTYDQPIHMVITDVLMPNMCGRELFEEAQKLKNDLKFLFLSGYTEDVLVQQGIDAGHISFMEKPYSVNSLLNKVRAILDSKKDRSLT